MIFQGKKKKKNRQFLKRQVVAKNQKESEL